MNKIKNNKVYSSLTKVSSWTGLSRVFGLIRDISTTSLLGASVFHDIFVVTLKIPNLFRRFFSEGAFNQAFIPIYSDYQKNQISVVEEGAPVNSDLLLKPDSLKLEIYEPFLTGKELELEKKLIATSVNTWEDE